MMFVHRIASVLSVFFVLLALSSGAMAAEWPQERQINGYTLIVYQPQPENLEGQILTGRAAMSIQSEGEADPVYGVLWFSARVETNRDQDEAVLSDFHITQVGWPDSKDAAEQRFTSLVDAAISDTAFTTSLSSLTDSLTASAKVKASLEELNNDPPQVRFSDQLAVLLTFDGKPRFKEIENSHYERALNTPMAVVKDKKHHRYYLTSGALWYEAADPLGPWQHSTNPPADLVEKMPKPEEAAPPRIPTIVVATEPTELVVTDGKADWVSLEGGELLYVKNTETPWLRELATGNMYLQLSGRWYRSKKSSGPWVFVRPDGLPGSFKEIPPASDIGGLRTSVAGTPEAERAVVDAQIPQTAAIKRSEASLKVEYDGKPKFEAIKGTEVSYAVNTGAQVLRIDGHYYAVDNGVWFQSSAATGPWVVADSIPKEKIQEIPPSAPVYNTTYVTVYDSTPEVVYVGYTPGYLWSFPYYGVPVYGTGWYYPPYWGAWYYPRPPTWGLHVGYNPWTGWNFGVSWGGPFLRFGVVWGGGWGPAPYRPWGCCGGWYGGGYRNTNINIHTGDINIGNNVNVGNRTNIGNQLGNREQVGNRKGNLYNRSENQHRNADRQTARANLKQGRGSAGTRNDLFADNRGQVVKKGEANQWQQRSNNRWEDVPGSGARDGAANTREKVAPKERSHSVPDRRPQPSSFDRQFNHQQMNREFRARNMGRHRGGGRRGR